MVESGQNLWNTHFMTIGAEKRANSAGKRLLLLSTRVLIAAVLTSAVGALANTFYEYIHTPALQAATFPFARAAGTLAIFFPIVLAGLVVIGMPTAAALRCTGAESALTYGVAGTVAGTLLSLVIFGSLRPSGIVSAFAFCGCSSALFWWWLRPRS